MKILVVEDDRHLNKAICDILNIIGDTDSIYTGDEALDAVAKNIYDLIILDVMLPGTDGFQVLKQARDIGRTPIIMLTAKDSVADKVKALRIGADDYMTKPFYRDELIARVNALLRRYNDNFTGFLVSFKDMKFDLSQKKVTLGSDVLDINGKSYDILEYLVRNKGTIITKEQLFNRIWGFASETIWTVVEVYVSNIRKLLKKYNYHIYLKTVRNVGYLWSE